MVQYGGTFLKILLKLISLLNSAFKNKKIFQQYQLIFAI